MLTGSHHIGSNVVSCACTQGLSSQTSVRMRLGIRLGWDLDRASLGKRWAAVGDVRQWLASPTGLPWAAWCGSGSKVWGLSVQAAVPGLAMMRTQIVQAGPSRLAVPEEATPSTSVARAPKVVQAATLSVAVAAETAAAVAVPVRAAAVASGESGEVLAAVAVAVMAEEAAEEAAVEAAAAAAVEAAGPLGTATKAMVALEAATKVRKATEAAVAQVGGVPAGHRVASVPWEARSDLG